MDYNDDGYDSYVVAISACPNKEYLATGFSSDNVEPVNCVRIDNINGDIGRWTQDVQTIIKVGEDLWAIDWERGLTAIQENLFYEQPYRVVRKEMQITKVYYEKI